MALEVVQWVFIAILLVLPLLYELNGTFKYYAKIFLYYTSVQLVAVAVILCSLWRPGDVENYRYVATFVNELRKLFGIDIEVRGREHLKGSEACIIVANHQTSLDFFGMMAIWPDRCVALAKKELRYMFSFGLAAILTGTIFIDRLNREKALSTMEETAAGIRNKKVKVFIFPEGTRNHDGGVLPFKKGAFHLAVQAQVPVIPVVFSSYNDFYNKREKRFDTGKLTITCLPPVSTEGMKQTDVAALTEHVREQILEIFNQSSAEIFHISGST
ncbi:1-acyl-sn-glycerol-3-phosphate acyltransferase alpha-like isoform X2 [Pomacea canaliculata]|uniref:1-acyl-sn-glycerol-3-phosphate acyltransferase alpha-like isoform X2 n=1 Tax=Pomacea canaliculata TaxID=400727 RepID=UPI000D739A4C|nr:1-acyl-sn-glycerol-3-phosphate acyltransferase alpha-like isoform X2 [Pomacea canaliculata]